MVSKYRIRRKTRRHGTKGAKGGKGVKGKHTKRTIKRSLHSSVHRNMCKQKGGNSATLRDPARYNDLVDVIYDPEERDGFSAPVLVSRDTHDTMFGLDQQETELSNSNSNSNVSSHNNMNGGINSYTNKYLV